MKRSVQVSVPLLASAALAITTTGCHPHADMQRCVDEHNHVVADTFCQNPNTQQQMRNSSGGFYFPYRYYYGGAGGYGLGSSVYGGGYAPIGGRSYASPSSSTSRGGFGSTHGGGSGAGGEGGGHGGGSGGE